MSYTIKQKREALAKGELWWRFPGADDASDAAWTNEADMSVRSPVAEYFIGPTPPRVLSELEGELLEALKEVIAVFDSNPSSIVDTVWVTGNRPETLYDLCLAAIQKAESTT